MAVSVTHVLSSHLDDLAHSQPDEEVSVVDILVDVEIGVVQELLDCILQDCSSTLAVLSSSTDDLYHVVL